jgi:hypothetical protein
MLKVWHLQPERGMCDTGARTQRADRVRRSSAKLFVAPPTEGCHTHKENPKRFSAIAEYDRTRAV